MPINKKIIDQIDIEERPKDFKKLMLEILNAEDTYHRYKKEFEKIINDYLKGGKSNG